MKKIFIIEKSKCKFKSRINEKFEHYIYIKKPINTLF